MVLNFDNLCELMNFSSNLSGCSAETSVENDPSKLWIIENSETHDKLSSYFLESEEPVPKRRTDFNINEDCAFKAAAKLMDQYSQWWYSDMLQM